MTVANEQVLVCVYAAIDEANEDRLELPPLEKRPETHIFGNESGLDSLGLITFLVAVEEGVEDKIGASVALNDERIFSQEPSPFQSVQALVDYIEVLLREQET